MKVACNQTDCECNRLPKGSSVSQCSRKSIRLATGKFGNVTVTRCVSFASRTKLT